MIRRDMAVAAACLPLAVAPSGAQSATPRFEQVFSTRGEPARLHYIADYRSADGVHRLEVWRDGDRRIKRATDGVIVTVAEHRPDDAGYRMTMLDLKRRISTRVDRTNLYRIGQFTDWFDLGHGLRHPKAAYSIKAGAAPAGAPAPVRSCRWYHLIEGVRTTRVCWDRTSRLPLILASGDGRPLWRVRAIDDAGFDARTFVVNDQGFVSNDANRDIERD